MFVRWGFFFSLFLFPVFSSRDLSEDVWRGQVLGEYDCDNAAGDCKMQVAEAGLGDAVQEHGHGHYEPEGVPGRVAKPCLSGGAGGFF